MDRKTDNEVKAAKWSRFCGGLLDYIHNYYCSFIETDYEVELDMTNEEVLHELQNSNSVNDLSPQLKKVAQQYEIFLKI